MAPWAEVQGVGLTEAVHNARRLLVNCYTSVVAANRAPRHAIVLGKAP